MEAEAADAAAAATAERTSLISWIKDKRESNREMLFLSSREVWKLIGKKCKFIVKVRKKIIVYVTVF